MKKCASVLIAALLSLTAALSGCSGRERTTVSLPRDEIPEASRGKYVQQDITPPELAGAEVTGLHQLPDGRIVAICTQRNQPPRAFATLDGSAWEAVFPLGEGASLYADYPEHWATCALDNDGDWWIGFSTREGENHLFQVVDGVPQEIEVSAFAAGQGGHMGEMQIDSGNTMLLTVGGEERADWIVLDCTAGKEISASPLPPCVFFDYREGNIYFSGYEETALTVMEAATGKQLERLSTPMEAAGFQGMRGQVTGGETLHYVNQSGIHRVALGGSFVQTLVDNRSYAFADATFAVQQFLAAEDGSFWVAGAIGAGEGKLYRYLFDKDAKAVADETLRVWTMDDNSMLRFAVSIFAQENPDCEVIVEYGHSGETGAQTDEDIIRVLNTRLLTGDGPDVLILDGLPIRSMMNQGMLADLSGLVKEEEYYPNILSCFSQEGKAYAYPTLFWTTMMAQKGAAAGPSIGDIKTLEDLRQLIRPDQITYGGYYHMFETLYMAASPLIFPGDAALDADALRSFLSLTKDIVEAQGLSATEYDSFFGYASEESDAAVHNYLGFSNNSPSLGYYVNETQGDASHAAGTLYGYDVWLFNREGDSFAPLPGNTFLPLNIVGVPEGAPNPDAGKRFAKTMLECQSVENMAGKMLAPGFLVRRGVEKGCMLAINGEMFEEKGWDLDAINLDGTLEQLTTASSNNFELRQKLYTQAKLLYTGKITLEEAVAAVEKNTALYFAELQ